jgi:glycerol-3-phosphate acyltransferase PlsY
METFTHPRRARSVLVAVCVVVAFVLGSIPFSFGLGRLFLRVDIRGYGDGNPGAGNAWRAGGWRVGVPGAILDYSKGAAPVAVAHYGLGMSAWALVPVAAAPVLGHAFSPWLRGRGGKAIAATFGIWSALTLLPGFLCLAVTMGIFWRLQKADGWATVAGLLGLLTYLLIFAPYAYLLAIWALTSATVMWKQRRDLMEPVHFRALSPREKAGEP